jgi:outer membrane protein assembly factor BamB
MANLLPSILLLLAAGAIPLCAQLAGSDWPQLLGPTRNQIYTGPWSEKSSFASAWKREIGEGFSAPVVAQGRVLIFHRKNDREILDALDAATGKPLWSFAYPTCYRDDFGFSEGPRATPTADGDQVFTYGAEGMLHCVNLKTGAKVWQVDARQAFGIRKEFFGTGCSPLVDGDRVLMNIGGAAGAGIVALDRNTGKTVWKALTHESGYSSPVAAMIGGERHILFFTREGLVDADPATGRIRFEQPWRARMAASVNAAVPVVVGDEVFVSTSYGVGAALWKIQGDKAKQVWSGDDSISNHYSTSVYKDGYLYGFHGRQEQGQELRCIEWKTGKVKWSVPDLRAGTVTLAGSHLFVLRENGELLIAPANPKSFQPVKSVKLSEPTLRAYPALAGGRLYVRTDSLLSAWRMD